MPLVNAPAFPSPYVDPALTVRNPPHQNIVPVPATSGPKTLGEIRVYDDFSTDRVGPFPVRTPPKHAPQAWARRRDPYAIDGMTGQDFFKNPV